MNISKGLTEEHAKQICNWKYIDEYSVYNLYDWDICVRSQMAITVSKKRAEEFYSVLDDNNEIFGFFRIKYDADKIMIGLGIKPDSCGKGYGQELLEIILDICSKEYHAKYVELEVRGFNKRAIKCYEKSGFKIIDEHYNERDEKFILMRYMLEQN